MMCIYTVDNKSKAIMPSLHVKEMSNGNSLEEKTKKNSKKEIKSKWDEDEEVKSGPNKVRVLFKVREMNMMESESENEREGLNLCLAMALGGFRVRVRPLIQSISSQFPSLNFEITCTVIFHVPRLHNPTYHCPFILFTTHVSKMNVLKAHELKSRVHAPK